MLLKTEDLAFFAVSTDDGVKSMLWATKDKPTDIRIKYNCVCGHQGEITLPKQGVIEWKCEKCGKLIKFVTYKVEKKLKKKKK